MAYDGLTRIVCFSKCCPEVTSGHLSALRSSLCHGRLNASLRGRAAVGGFDLMGRCAVPNAAQLLGRTVSRLRGAGTLWRETREFLWIPRVSRRYKHTNASPCTGGVHGPLDCLRTILDQNPQIHVIRWNPLHYEPWSVTDITELVTDIP